MAKSKLLPFVAIGAIVGAAISMLDKNTREHTVSTVKNAKDTVTYYAQNRGELENLIASKVEQVQTLYTNNQEMINSILSGAQDAKVLPETLLGMINETKEAFSKK
jgi:hypothetical protein